VASFNAHTAWQITQFNAAMRQGKYEEGLRERLTGESIEQLWAGHIRELKKGLVPEQ
jgi:hypothetical protein